MTAPEPIRARLTVDEKNYLFANLLRSPVVFGEGQAHLDPALIDPVCDGAYLCLWRAALNVAVASGGRIPEDDRLGRTLVEMEAQKVAQLDPVNIRADHVSFLFGSSRGMPGLIEWIYSLQPEELSSEHAKKFLAGYLEERTVYESLVLLADRVQGPVVPASLQPFLDRIETQRSRIAGLTAERQGLPVIDFTQESVLKTSTTGLTFLDEFMCGGQVDGEMYTVMGPTGSGKSILGGQLFMRGALAEQQRYHSDKSRPLRHWYYFNFENHKELIYRLWAHAAQVDATTLMAHGGDQGFSTSDRLKDYERDMIPDGGGPPQGEVERLAEAQAKWLQYPNFWPQDYSGAVPGVGGGGVPEMARFLESERYAGRPVAGIVIDYAGLAVDRYIQSGHAEKEQLYAQLNGFGQQVVNQICARFDCVAWVLHQLHGESAKRAPTARYHHSDGQGAKNFANAAWFAFQIGNKDQDTQCATIWCTKSRRAKGSDVPALVRIDGPVLTMVDENARYTVSKFTQQIVPRAFEDKILGGSGGRQSGHEEHREARAARHSRFRPASGYETRGV